MGVFLKLFITILAISVLLSIAFPGEETQFLKDNLFSKLLTEQTDPTTNETYYDDITIAPEWTKGGNQDSNFLTKFIDGLSVIKTTVNTLINIAVLPITMAIKLKMPGIIKILFFVPLALIYIISAIMIFIRGVQP